MTKKAFITGITGQDGIHLSQLLLSKNYDVTGMVSGQRSKASENFRNLFPDVKIIQGDLTDFSSVIQSIEMSDPNEIYNLGAISFVGLSFTQPELTANVTGLGLLRVLEAVRKLHKEKEVRIYQASSSEMFGKVRETPQNELTPFHPRSPYGVAKTFAHYTSVQFREAYDMFIASGILFNHEGENRGHEFVTRKITSNVARIKLGKQEKFSLGNISASRDWGYAGDYVKAMWKMLQAEIPDDFVIATGKAHSVQDFVIEALLAAELEPDLNRYLDYDQKMIRPSEVETLVGDYSKARKILKWEPEVNFQELVALMVENDLRIESEKN
jgi:GDPmannose 4,6-dehydratase